jgi:triphosphoribosyl-dephospho-CoA synthase
MTKEDFFNYIRDLCLKSMLYEVTVAPKPGLVDRFNSGAHMDMDIFTFMDSSLSLNTYFYDCVKLGYEFDVNDYTNILKALRPIGIKAEEKMFKATNGVNTHKGLIFSLGIISAAAGVIYRKTNNIYIDELEISKLVKEITKGLTDELLDIENKEKLTYGERLYKRYGVKGVRGEAESGFSTVMKYSLPKLKYLMEDNKYHINDVLVNVLLNLMANTEDSNILGRHNKETLNYVQKESQKAIELGGYFTKEGKAYIESMDKDFIGKNISPGGSADLLAVSIMIYILKNGDII